jgi:ankyrin repeat protein
MTTNLHPNPSLENLKKQAKSLLKTWHAGDPHTLARIRAAHPRYGGLSQEQFGAVAPRLTDCQLVLARETGFDSWPQLNVAIQAAGRELQDEFVEIACLCYDDPHYDHRTFHARAHEMLREKPWLMEASIWCAAAAGNVDAVRMFLDGQPHLVNQPGPHGWTPLICACYSRVKPVNPGHSTFDAAKLLLDRGADANAFTMKGNADERLNQKPRRFTALTGLFGGGSTGLANQPPHPRWRELAELLLTRGANPAEEGALQINQNACLELLLRYGLRPDAVGTDGVSLLGRAISQAARRDQVDQVQMLLAHHARTDEKFQGKTPWEHAMSFGRLEVARLLEDAGATVSELNEVERFVSLCLAGEERGAREMLAHAPDLLKQVPQSLVLKATGTGRTAAVRLVLDLGFDPDILDEVTALHNAVGKDNEKMVRLLLERGASPCIREPFYDGTPVGWADFFEETRARNLLLSEGAICLFDALDFDRLDRVADILARDPAALNRPFAECLSREPKPGDWQTPLVRMVLCGKTEAVRVLLDHGADIGACHPDGRSLLKIAQDQGFLEIANLLGC